MTRATRRGAMAARLLGRPGKWLALLAAATCAAFAYPRIVTTEATESDVPTFLLLGALLLALGVAATLAALEVAARRGERAHRRARAAVAYAWAAYAGFCVAVLVLAYKDNTTEEWRAIPAWAVPLDFVYQLVVAPVEAFFALYVGFRDPFAPAYLAAGVVLALALMRALRRRLAPDLRGVSAGSSVGP